MYTYMVCCLLPGCSGVPLSRLLQIARGDYTVVAGFPLAAVALMPLRQAGLVSAEMWVACASVLIAVLRASCQLLNCQCCWVFAGFDKPCCAPLGASPMLGAASGEPLCVGLPHRNPSATIVWVEVTLRVAWVGQLLIWLESGKCVAAWPHTRKQARTAARTHTEPY